MQTDLPTPEMKYVATKPKVCADDIFCMCIAKNERREEDASKRKKNIYAHLASKDIRPTPTATHRNASICTLSLASRISGLNMNSCASSSTRAV